MSRTTGLSSSINALLCDVDGVVRHWPGMAEIEAEHGLRSGSMRAAAFSDARLLPAITGLVTDTEWRRGVAAVLAAEHEASSAEAAVAAWSALLPTVDTEFADLLRRTRRIMPVALVSNATSRLEEDLLKQGIDDIADFVVNTSRRLGFAKPDPRVFHAAARTVGVPPTRCLFIDDTPGHVAAVRELGMPAVHFRTIADVVDALGLPG